MAAWIAPYGTYFSIANLSNPHVPLAECLEMVVPCLKPLFDTPTVRYLKTLLLD